MDTTHFSRHADSIRSLELRTLSKSHDIPPTFLLGQDGELTSHYIPFDVVNRNAKVVVVGITPGFTQWKNAMREAQRQLLAGATLETALLTAKQTGAFSGAMRPNLVRLLDTIGLHRWLNITSCEGLFSAQASLLQSTSILPHPVFVKHENYNGTPNMIKNPFLRKLMLDHFAEEATQLPDAVFIPLGPKVSEGLSWMVREGILKEDRVLSGLPHPSGANAERIAYFVGKKSKSALSTKTNASQLDSARASLISRIAALA